MATIAAGVILAGFVFTISWLWISAIDSEDARRNGATRLTRATAKRIRRGRP